MPSRVKCLGWVDLDDGMDEGHSREVVDKYIISLQVCKGFQHPLISASGLSAIIDVLRPLIRDQSLMPIVSFTF